MIPEVLHMSYVKYYEFLLTAYSSMLLLKHASRNSFYLSHAISAISFLPRTYFNTNFYPDLIFGMFQHVCSAPLVLLVFKSPYGFETSRLPHFLNNRLTDGEVVSLAGSPCLTPGRFLVLVSVRG
jgi:hypothetical protein